MFNPIISYWYSYICKLNSNNLFCIFFYYMLPYLIFFIISIELDFPFSSFVPIVLKVIKCIFIVLVVTQAFETMYYSL